MSTFSATRWNLFGALAQPFIRLAATLVLAQLLFPADFAIMAIATILLGFLDVFMDFGTAQALIQRKELSRELISSVFFFNVAVATALAVAVFVTTPFIARFSRIGDAVPVLRALSFSTVVVGIGLTKRALLMRDMRFRQLAWIQVGGATAYAVASTVSAFWGYGVWSLVAGHYAYALTSTGGMWLAHEWNPERHFSWKDLRSIAVFGGNLAVYQVVSYFLRQAHKPLISRYLGPDALGYFSMAERVVIQPSRALATSLAAVMYSRFAKLQDNDVLLRQGFVRATAGLALIIIPSMLAVGLAAPSLVAVCFDQRWNELDHLISALAPSGVFFSFLFLCNSLFFSKLRTDLLLGWGIAHAVLTLTAYAFGLRYGIVGSAVCYSAAMGLLSIPTFAIPLSLIRTSVVVIIRALRPHLFAALAMVPAVLLPQLVLANAGYAASYVFVVSSLLGTAVYTAIIFALRPPALTDLLRIVSMRK